MVTQAAPSPAVEHITPAGKSEELQEEDVAVIIVDHGSRLRESNNMLFEFADLYRNTTGRSFVEVAHMELASPSIADAMGKVAARGAKKVIVAPYFLSRGRHIQEDIPALVAAAQKDHPDLECTIAEPIGIDPLMAQLIEHRVTASLGASS
ncbi:hypothetical protein WJX72_009874 [[Myrmecia] bisecta]|uniref:Sirohydrochlorin cobaltochelatase n=1 Tax=[Myrmecia] bisecta TaxID=41462 RepID=A0AAW1QB38_9CHLO